MKKQQGFVLVFTVVLLSVAAMMGLYAMRSTVMQDKMTANLNNKTITTNAAEDGAAVFYDWVKNRFVNNGWPTSNSDKAGWKSVIPYTSSGNLTVNSGSNGYYWINPTANIVGCAVANTNPCWDETNKQVIALISGNLVKTNGTSTVILGESIYKIRIAAPGGLKLPQLPAPLTLAGNVSNFTAGNSNQFKIQGGDRLAIATLDSASATMVKNAIPNNRADAAHYGGTCTTAPCISATDLGMWGNPNEVMQYVSSIESNSEVKVYTGNFSGSLPCSGIIIVKGDFDVNGNIAGSGCGNTFTGAIIVLGGSMDVSGGGALDIRGAVYVTDIIPDSANPGNYKFGNNSTGFKGGGNMTITYDGSYFGTSSDINGGGLATSTRILAWSDVL